MSTVRCYAPAIFLAGYALLLGLDVVSDRIRWPGVLAFCVTIAIHIHEQRQRRDARRD